MSNLPPPTERFKANVKALTQICSELISRAQKQGLTDIDLMTVRFISIMLENYDSKELIDQFITYSFPYWEQIRTCDEKFFELNAERIFPSYDNKTVTVFKELFFVRTKEGKLFITPEEKERIWKLFESLVKVSLHHIHESRDPVVDRNTKVATYRKEAYNHVTKLPELIQVWKLKNLRFQASN
jgi:hypothetical protein